MRRILYISGSRSDWGLMRSVLDSIRRHPRLKLEIAATGMHLMREFGYSIKKIEAEGYVVHRVDCTYRRDDKESMARFVGSFTQKLTSLVARTKPEIILVIGDRGEMLAAAIVGAYLGIPVAHVHGGDISSTVDELVRHAITKLAHIHLTATRKSTNRIRKMGESAWRIHTVGAPGLDSIIHQKKMSKKDVEKLLGISLNPPFIVVVQHSVSAEVHDADRQMRETLEAVVELGLETIVIYPNADAGGRKMIKVIKEYSGFGNIHIFKNIEHDLFISLLSRSAAIVGNSSSGLIESLALGLPAVNIGTRQGERERTRNVINVPHDRREIQKAVKKAVSPLFKAKIRKNKNPYGDGNAGKRITTILSQVKIDGRLIQKRLEY
jgi:GDP/UDP-N,N'-diacetylbacillosamine 2-epimerase (hydrolysing)